MARTMINHACEGCGAVRKVSPDKKAKGLQRYCRQCQGPVAAHKRREAMIKRGGPRHTVYATCKECRGIYETRPINDDGYCCDRCKSLAQNRGYSMGSLVASVMNGQLWKPTGSVRKGNRKGTIKSPPREHWVQRGIFEASEQ